MFLVLYVLHDESRLNEILDAWGQAGVGGITILPSTGMGRMVKHMTLREDMPLIPSLRDLLDDHEQMRNQTIFSIVESPDLAEKLHAVTENIVGPLDDPDTGIMAVLPLIKVYGLRRRPEEHP
jgi:hypothetical protein